MKSRTLKCIYSEHVGKVSDKWSSYIDNYDGALKKYKEKAINFLEIGVQNGGSLEIWANYFLNAHKIIGCDIDPKCADLEFADSRIGVIVGDANSPQVLTKINEQFSEFDVIIEDGSHMSSDIIKTFANYFPLLSEGGVFVFEDLHCSYWKEFEGGLYNPYSAVSFFKRLVDVVNFEHWGTKKYRSDILSGFYQNYGFRVDESVLSLIHSVEFYNSICIVHKTQQTDNLLGDRLILGNECTVVPTDFSLAKSKSLTPSQENNTWTREISPEESVLGLEAEISVLKSQIADRDNRMRDLQSSVSWKLTKPLRFLKSIFIKLLMFPRIK